MGGFASRHVRFRVDPRDVAPEKAARRLGLTLSAFEEKLPALLGRGFPHPDQTTGMFDLVAIEAWMDRRSPLTAQAALTESRPLRDAREVFNGRRAALGGQG